MADTTVISENVLQTIASYPWDQLGVSTGYANDIPRRLRGLISATSDSEAKSWYFLLENYIVVQGGVFEAALPSIEVLLSAIKNSEINPVAISWIYELIFQITNGVTDIEAIRRGNLFEAEKCKEFVRKNFPILKAKYTGSDPDILDWIAHDLSLSISPTAET